MLRRPLHVWIIFTACLLAGVGVMAWVTHAALQLAKTETEVRRNAALEENVRLALWRMESALAPLVAQESARPYYLYGAYYTGYYHGAMEGTKGVPEKIRIPSPLALHNPPFTLLHFQIAPTGKITSPQIATGDASPPTPDAGRTQRRSQQELLHLQSLLKYSTLLDQLQQVEDAMPMPTPDNAETPAPLERERPPAAAPLPAEAVGGAIALAEKRKASRDSETVNAGEESAKKSLSSGLATNKLQQAESSFSDSSARALADKGGVQNADYFYDRPADRDAAPAPQAGAAPSAVIAPAPTPAPTTKLSAARMNAPVPQNPGVQQPGALQQLLAQQDGNGANQQAKSMNEYQMRQLSMSNVAQSQNPAPIIPAKDELKNANAASPDAREGGMRAIWADDALLLVRRVSLDNKAYLQGCSLDWPEIRKYLLNATHDLLPQAALLPVESLPAQNGNGARLLATLPVRLLPGCLPAQPETPLHPIQFALIITWGCLGIAALAVALLLAGTLSLSERRATFVSAVTHELRTPLTTLRMYSEMLSEGRVRSEEKIAHYHRTINTEAGRLAHLVENVLSYARLERGRPGNRAETIALPELLERIAERLADRARQVGMEFHAEITPTAQAAMIHANLSSVEQILFNLVDNACKYAVSSDDKRICLHADASERTVTLSVRDFGPGIDKKESRKLFRAFHKSAHDAAHSAPGVGLGLALSRRLARAMQGDLRYDTSKPGACFVLTLPLATKERGHYEKNEK